MVINMKQSGFTLIELSIVLFILGLVLGSILRPLAVHRESRMINEAAAHIEEIKQSITGFVVRIENNNFVMRLPCPAPVVDSSNINYGIEDCSLTEGVIPHRTLGVLPLDPWGNEYRYVVDRAYTVSGNQPGGRFGMGTKYVDYLVVRDAANNIINGTGDPFTQPETGYPAAVIFSAGPDGNIDIENINNDATYQQGSPDDILAWVNPLILYSIAVSAGALPFSCFDPC